MNIDRWREFAVRFGEARDRNLSSGNCVDIWGIDELGRRELRYSAILAWLFDETADHGQGNRFLRSFLNHIATSHPKDTEKLREFTDYSYSVRTESVATEHEHLDIFFESEKILLAIEVKVDAKEHNKQLTRYAEWLKYSAKKKKKDWYLLYLTKDGIEGSSSDATPVSWLDLSKSVQEALQVTRGEHPAFGTSLSFELISQFAERVRNF